MIGGAEDIVEPDYRNIFGNAQAGITQFATICQLCAIDGLITDARPDDTLVRAFAEAAVELRIAELGKAGIAA